MSISEQISIDKHHRSVLAGITTCLLTAFLALPAWSQETVTTQSQSDFSISQLAAEPRPDYPSELISADHDQTLFNPYDLNDLEPAIESGIRSQEASQHALAIEAFEQALQITRIRYGLFHEAQLPLLEGILVSGIELRDWEMVDQRYAYMENLYRRLYDIDDPRLEIGLEKISSFHINAFNSNLDGRREYHLRQAAKLFRTRLEVAENTLVEGHPRFAYLNQGIELSRQHLYLLSASQRQELGGRENSKRDQLLAGLE